MTEFASCLGLDGHFRFGLSCLSGLLLSQSHTHICRHTQTRTNNHTVWSDTQTHTRTPTLTQTPKQAHAYTDTHTHTHTHKDIHMDRQTDRHTHTSFGPIYTHTHTVCATLTAWDSYPCVHVTSLRKAAGGRYLAQMTEELGTGLSSRIPGNQITASGKHNLWSR